ncbi:MAG: metallophosphoesterase [Myxococcota bacterium]
MKASNDDSLCILHLTDIHFREKDRSEIARRLQAIPAALEPQGLRSDLVLITGDIVYSGKREEYEAFHELLLRFAQELAVDFAQIIVCPGNHDVDRARVDIYSEIGYQTLIKNPGDADALWSNDAKRKDATARQDAFNAFAANFGKATQSIQLGARSIGISALNSAWRAFDDGDKGRLFLSTSQIIESLKQIQETEIRILATHHPIAWLAESEQDVVTSAVTQNYDIYCHGHRHVTEAYLRVGVEAGIVTSAAKAVFDPNLPNGFSHLCIRPAQREVDMRMFAYFANQLQYRIDTELANTGQSTFKLSPKKHRESATPLATLTALRRTVDASRLKVNQSLTGLAPKLSELVRLEDILPRLRVKVPGHKSPKAIHAHELLARGARPRWIVRGSALSGRSWIKQHLAETSRQANISPLLVTGDRLLGVTTLQQFNTRLAEASGLSTNKLKAVLRGGPAILVDDVGASDIENVKRLINVALNDNERARAIIFTEPGISSESVSEIEHIGSDAWSVAEVAPMALSSITQLVGKLADQGMVAIKKSDVRSFVHECFQSELPRLPWVMLMFLELAVEESSALAGNTLPELTRKFVELRISPHTDRGRKLEYASSPTIRRRYLAVLARQMFEQRKGVIVAATFVDAIAADVSKAGLELRAEGVLESLLETGLIMRDGHQLQFCYPPFLDYFYAESLIEGNARPWETMDSLGFSASASAYGFYLTRRTVDAPSILDQAFGLAQKAAGDAVARSVSLSEYATQFLNIDISAVEAADSIDMESIAEELELEADHIENSQRGTHRSRLESSGDSTKIPEIGTLALALRSSALILRSATFIDNALKRSYAESCVSLAATLIQKMLADSELQHGLAESLESNAVKRRRLRSLVAAILVVTGSSILSQAGAGYHLKNALEELLASEKDDFRLLVILCWLSALYRDSLEGPVRVFIEGRPSYEVLKIAELWFFSDYVFYSALEGHRDQIRRRAIELLAEESARRSYSERVQNQTHRAKEHAQAVLRRADEAVRETE